MSFMKSDKIKHEILIIEDNRGDLVLIEDLLLEKFGSISISQALSFEDVKLQLTAENNFSVILLDFFLPDLSGRSLIEGVQKLSKGIPIIILTGYSDLRVAKESLSKGISDFLIKDEISAEVLYKSIIYAIERKKFITELKSSQELYHDLFSLSPQPMWLYETATLKFLDVNNASIAKYGYSREEFLTMTISEICPLHLQDSIHIEPKGKRNSLNQEYVGLFTHQIKSGNKIKVEIYSNHIKYNNIDAQIILANDITDKLNHIQTIELQNERLKEIAWTQSHIVRAPLVRILGIIQLFENEALSESEMPVFLEYLKISAYEMDGLVQKIVSDTQVIDLNEKDRDQSE